jgi:hypothetical protein
MVKRFAPVARRSTKTENLAPKAIEKRRTADRCRQQRKRRLDRLISSEEYKKATRKQQEAMQDEIIQELDREREQEYALIEVMWAMMNAGEQAELGGKTTEDQARGWAQRREALTVPYSDLAETQLNRVVEKLTHFEQEAMATDDENDSVELSELGGGEGAETDDEEDIDEDTEVGSVALGSDDTDEEAWDEMDIDSGEQTEWQSDEEDE